jgi:hypothetical protein
MPAQGRPDITGHYLIDRGLALGAARAQRRRPPAPGALWKAHPGWPFGMGRQRCRLKVIGVFQQPDPGSVAMPVEVRAAVLDGDYEHSQHDGVHRRQPLPCGTG